MAQLLNSVLLFTLSLLIFTFGINQTEVVSFDTRFYLFATEMWRHGFTWFPMTYGQPYPDYPVTSTALIYGISKLMGGLSKFTAVLPSAMAASFIVVYTKKLGSLYDKRLGWAAVGFLFLTLSFLKSARAISLDMYPALAALICCYHLAHAELQKRKRSHLLLAAMFIVGFIMRGPVGLVIPAGVVSVFHLCNKQYRRFFIDGFHALFWLILGTSALLALAYHVGGMPFLRDVSRMEGIGRIDNYFLPYYFYFTDSVGSYALSYPLAVFVFFGFLYAQAKNTITRWPHAKAVLQWIAYALVILIGMSLPGDKKVRYILGITPAIALLAAYPFVMNTSSVFLKRLQGILTFLITCLPLLFIAVLVKVMTVLPYQDWNIKLPFFPLIIFLIFLQCLSFFQGWVEKDKALRGLWVVLVAALAFVVLDLRFVEPIEINLDSARVFVNEIETMRANQQAALVFYKERPDGLPIKYLVNMTTDDDPVFVETSAALLQIKKPAIIITSLDYYKTLTRAQKARFNQVSKGSLGHVPVLVLTPVR